MGGGAPRASIRGRSDVGSPRVAALRLTASPLHTPQSRTSGMHSGPLECVAKIGVSAAGLRRSRVAADPFRSVLLINVRFVFRELRRLCSPNYAWGNQSQARGLQPRTSMRALFLYGPAAGRRCRGARMIGGTVRRARCLTANS